MLNEASTGMVTIFSRASPVIVDSFRRASSFMQIAHAYLTSFFADESIQKSALAILGAAATYYAVQHVQDEAMIFFHTLWRTTTEQELPNGNATASNEVNGVNSE